MWCRQGNGRCDLTLYVLHLRGCVLTTVNVLARGLSGGVRDSQPARPGSLPVHGSHCVLEAGGNVQADGGAD